jgi:hypothetical protein
MDHNQQAQVIETRLDALDAMTITDDASAHEAFRHVMVTVGQISQLSAQARAQGLVGGGALTDDVFGTLGTWLDRLVGPLTRIVTELDGATSFSITAGGNVSVTVAFGSSPRLG